MPILRRRPVLRAAAIGGGAYMVGKRRQQAKGQDQEEQAQASPPEAQQAASPTEAPPAGGISDDAIQRLDQLGKLHEQGVLTDEEFAKQKTALLGE
jgi:Short C-terminal domain